MELTVPGRAMRAVLPARWWAGRPCRAGQETRSLRLLAGVALRATQATETP